MNRLEVMVPASVFIEGPPVPKARPRVVNGHTYTPKRTKAYEDRIGWAWREQIPAWFFYGNICVSLRVWEEPRSPQKQGDVDNYIKVALDALNGIAFKDDRSVIRVEAEVTRNSTDRAGMLITVMELS